MKRLRGCGALSFGRDSGRLPTSVRPGRNKDAMTTLTALLIALLLALGTAPSPVRAQTNEGGSFLDPFPENDKYRVQVWGDQMGDGLQEGLAELIAAEPRLQLDKKHRWLSGIMKADIDQEAKTIETALATGAPHIAVVILGAGDRIPLRRANNRRFNVGSDEWKEEYGRRLDLVMRAMRKRQVAVFWVGLPVMRRQEVTDDAEVINELIRSRALANGVRYIDIFASFAGPDKSYDANGPDLAGKIRNLRDNDGVHFSGAGYRKVAYFVERELKRAAAQAWDERTIPLAGSEDEQSRIRPPSTVKLAPLAASVAKKSTAGPAAGASDGPGAAKPGEANSPGDRGVMAEHSRITLKSIGTQGREESVTLEILRPAIPATVVALLTRRESENKASQVGDTVMTEILGGLTVVSSVTPLAEPTGERRRTAAAASPLSSVLQRGETLPPKPGRADEMPWPRLEPVLEKASAWATPVAPTPAAAKPARAEPKAATPPPAADVPPLPRRPTKAKDGKNG